MNKSRKNQQKQLMDERLSNSLQTVFQRYQLLLHLEEEAYDVPEDLNALRKIERAKYLCLMREARQRNIQGDIVKPRKVKAMGLKKRGYKKDNLYQD
ncbi:DUF2508 family protein [Jeotgalibaca sp. A127]|uniref:DUF2508 family protein n=1 Tax=Jeotgalibaca sp. A127 TaxID=3457324 RepID=UPI003FD185E0